MKDYPTCTNNEDKHVYYTFFIYKTVRFLNSDSSKTVKNINKLSIRNPKRCKQLFYPQQLCRYTFLNEFIRTFFIRETVTSLNGDCAKPVGNIKTIINNKVMELFMRNPRRYKLSSYEQ